METKTLRRTFSRQTTLHLIFSTTLLLSVSPLQAQVPVDPGPRPRATRTATTTNPKFATFSFTRTIEPRDALGADGAGAILTGSGNLAGFWGQSIAAFGATATVAGGPNNILGLGPAFNGAGCQQCHSQPTIGGTSGPVNFQADPSFVHDHGANNPADLSGFITADGPVREARFIINRTTGLPDGGVHELFSIQGRDDAPLGCQLAQPDFAAELAANNLIFRIPTPTFGLGFLENTPEATLRSNLTNEQLLAALFTPPLGITGHFNTNGNDGTITRFGWKAQNKSLLLFSGEAANVELGVTNELFQTEKVPGSACATNLLPEDITLTLAATDPLFTPPINPNLVTAKISSFIENFAVFMRLNGAAGQCAFNSGPDQCFSLTNTGGPDGQTDANAVASILRGKALFGTIIPSASPRGGNPNTGIGCVLCHTDVLTTGPSTAPGLNNQPFRPFSDLALHQMDAALADGIVQGAAAGDEFRTAPLWGIGQRLFFLHDGRARDLLAAILGHALGAGTGCTATSGEACQTIVNFNALPPVTPAGTTTPSQQDLLNFLRSL
jgi:Di-haem oxidoreductase, putative peroxidase